MGVTGIGGFFFRAADPDALTAWYRDMLGIAAGHDAIWNQEAGMTVFSPFKEASDYFGADKRWMLNLRVEGLDTMLDKLRGAGVEIITKPEWDTAEYGRFARIHDPEGNPIELWEPPTT
ncbi:VOC family protein [Sphingomonas sp. ID0503]|uniref:VOC family protein n=1 Tax=Sphingomonas sp. ID0503 TaxID=3399691 RepID=UPI003AFAE2A8